MNPIKSKGRSMEPTVWIGKNGLTKSQVEEIVNQLKKKRIVKIKMLRSYFEGKDRKELAREIAALTGSTLVESVGGVVVLTSESVIRKKDQGIRSKK